MGEQAEWKIVPSVAPGEYGVTIVDERGAIVASTYREHASLLRAAPALYAALRGFLGFVAGGYAVSSPYESTLQEHARQGRAAMKLAEGREP